MIMEKQRNKKPTPESIKKILEFLPKFQGKKFKPGKWHPSEQIDKNTSTFPYYEYSISVRKFLHTLYDEGFIYPFDWGSWDYGVKLNRNPELLQKANLLTLRKLMTAHVRQDRFCEGHLAGIFENGLVIRLLERLQQLSRNGSFSHYSASLKNCQVRPDH